MKAVMEFFATRKMSRVWMRIFVIPIPKKPDVAEPSHYRPINLCSTLYKICTKLMMERKKSILSHLPILRRVLLLITRVSLILG